MTSPTAELIAVGSELLEPWRTDTNGAYLSRRLGERGISVRFRTVVGDVMDDLKEVFGIVPRPSSSPAAPSFSSPGAPTRTAPTCRDGSGSAASRYASGPWSATSWMT